MKWVESSRRKMGERGELVDEEFHPVKSGACGYYVKSSLEPKSTLFN